jgi:hypothetical protein
MYYCLTLRIDETPEDDDEKLKTALDESGVKVFFNWVIVVCCWFCLHSYVSCGEELV